MRLLLAALLAVAGLCLVVYGVLLIYLPAAFILAGLVLVLAGMLTDFDRGGKRATARRPARK